MVIHPHDENILWLTASGYNSAAKVIKTTNGGNTWQSLTTSGIPNVPVNCIAYQRGSNNRIYIGTDTGVLFFDDNSTEWTEFSDGLPMYEVTDLEINYQSNEIFAGTYGRGAWKSDIYLDCEDELPLSGNQSGTDTFTSFNIESSATIQSNSNIKYLAVDEVKLISGFKTLNNTIFEINVNNRVCDDQYPNFRKGGSSQRIGYYGGPMPGLMNKLEPEESIEFMNDDHLIIYPNPSYETVAIEFQVNDPAPVRLDLIDPTGQIETIHQVTGLEKGNYEFGYNVSKLNPGIYVLLYHNGTSKQSKKMIVQMK